MSLGQFAPRLRDEPLVAMLMFAGSCGSSCSLALRPNEIPNADSGSNPGCTRLVGASWGLSWYIRTLASYNKTFGALGAVVALMLWLYVSALAIVLGAELNSEMFKSSTA